MHNYVSANNAFPKSAITDKAGKPLLSWRVAILPFRRAASPVQPVQARRAVGQPAQQGAHQGNPAGLPLPGTDERCTVHHNLPGVYGQGRAIRGWPGRGSGRRSPTATSNTLDGRRGEGRRALDQARRPEIRPESQAVALRRRLITRWRLQRRARRRLGPLHRRTRSSRTLFRARITRNAGEVLNFAEISPTAAPGAAVRAREASCTSIRTCFPVRTS